MSDGGGLIGWAVGKAVWIALVAAAVVGASQALRGTAPPADPPSGSERASPTPRETGGSRSIALRADRSGHFWADGEINGTRVRFIVDTGATGVALGPNMAERTGLRVRDRDFTLESQTANGVARAAPVTIRQLRVGAITLYNVDAHVVERPMPGMALLGMSFLSRLDGYEVRGDRMVLRW